MRSKDIKNPAMVIPAWVEWRLGAEFFVAVAEAVLLVEEGSADDVDEGVLPSSIRNLSRLILSEISVPCVEEVIVILCSPDVLNAREATTTGQELPPLPELRVSSSILIITSYDG